MNGWTVIAACVVIALLGPRFLRAAGLMPRSPRAGLLRLRGLWMTRFRRLRPDSYGTPLGEGELITLMGAERAWRDHAGTERVAPMAWAAEALARGEDDGE